MARGKGYAPVLDDALQVVRRLCEVIDQRLESRVWLKIDLGARDFGPDCIC